MIKHAGLNIHADGELLVICHIIFLGFSVGIALSAESGNVFFVHVGAEAAVGHHDTTHSLVQFVQDILRILGPHEVAFRRGHLTYDNVVRPAAETTLGNRINLTGVEIRVHLLLGIVCNEFCLAQPRSQELPVREEHALVLCEVAYALCAQALQVGIGHAAVLVHIHRGELCHQ